MIWSIKKAEANCWAKAKVGLPGPREKSRDTGKEEVLLARHWNGRHATTMQVRSWVAGNGGLHPTLVDVWASL